MRWRGVWDNGVIIEINVKRKKRRKRPKIRWIDRKENDIKIADICKNIVDRVLWSYGSSVVESIYLRVKRKKKKKRIYNFEMYKFFNVWRVWDYIRLFIYPM